MILNKRQFLVSGGILLLVVIGLLVASLLYGEKSRPALASANGQLTCDSAQYEEYNRNMLLAGEMTVGRIPASGTRQQQQKVLDAYAALGLPRDKTIVAAGHLPTGKVYTTVCANEKCTMEEMARPEQACMTDDWNGCSYLAMQFREKQYCFLTPADQ